MTEENHQAESSTSSSTRSSPLVQPESLQQTITPDPGTKNREIKKEKCRAMTKVVIRRLPPSMTQAQFVEQISPLPEHDYLYFVKADVSLGQYAFSRAYINFIDQRDIFIFREKFDNYVFVDAKGTEYPAVVEFAPFQRLPKRRAGKKKDVKCGSIETDPYYLAFLESLQNLETDPANAQPKTEYSYQPTDNTQKKVTTTPLLEYVKQRKQEKQRLKDEKREERRRRDIERRRAKDELTISKVLKNPESEKESNREPKEIMREERDKQSTKDSKSRNKRDEKAREKGGSGRDGKMQGKQQQPFGRERGEEGKNRETKNQKRNEEKRSHGKKEEKDRDRSKDPGWYEHKSGKKERGKGEPRDENAESKDHRKHDERESGAKEEKKYETKYGRKEKRNQESRDEDTKERKTEEKRGKSYEKMRLEKKRLAENKKSGGGSGDAKGNSKGMNSKREDRENFEKREKNLEIFTTPGGMASNRDDFSPDILAEHFNSTDNHFIEASSSRLELDLADAKIYCINTDNSSKKSSKRRQDFEDEGTRFHEANDYCSLSKKKIAIRRSSLESGAEGGGGGSGGGNGGDEGNRLRRHKSLDGGEQDNFRKNEHRHKSKNKKGGGDPRLERRIRNKDRPAMEIYRPGMGRFSKQRMEREKSMNDDRASLSQSPTPCTQSSSSLNQGKPSSCKQNPGAQSAASSPSSEVRSMTFKRSASRDLS